MKQLSVVYINSRKSADFENQKIEIENFCKYRFDIDRVFHDNQPPAVPASNRPEFVEMLNYCEKNGIPNIIFHDLEATLTYSDVFINGLSLILKNGALPYWAVGDFISGGYDSDERRKAVGAFFHYLNHFSAQKILVKLNKKTSEVPNRRPGRPPALDEKGISDLLAARRSGKTIGDVCRIFNVSRSTVSKILRNYPELKGEWKGSISPKK
ncbi:MAG: helix-turn-helix domain-containing protein [Methanomicrobiales archaeon]|nr:helix-turn-helix domain-containing protein [Methanomicrobiales archaeon]